MKFLVACLFTLVAAIIAAPAPSPQYLAYATPLSYSTAYTSPYAGYYPGYVAASPYSYTLGSLGYGYGAYPYTVL